MAKSWNWQPRYKGYTRAQAERLRIAPSRLLSLEERARAWPSIGTYGQERVHAQARAAYELHLDFLRAGVLGDDFARWLALHSGASLTTCYRRIRLGLALAVTDNPNQTQAELLAELRRKKQTPVVLDGLEDPPED